jgi:uncharacterized protein YdiU (UPF0061 family)
MNKLADGLHFQNSFQKLPKFLFEEVTPTPLKNSQLIHQHPLAKELGLVHLSSDDLKKWVNGEARLEGDQRISTRYAGHQFGVWAGQLGDGRAISLGEILTSDKKRFEVQLKGSGLTPFSRMGDGKAVIRSSVREYLCSEAMSGLNIPTTQVLALITGDDDVRRERIERSAIVARVFESNLRFGHFELCYHFNKPEVLNELIEYTRMNFFEGVSIEEMLREIIRRTATMIAHWQDVGFCHGVMNTDNMSVLGLTLDYGPYGFLEDTKLNHICNHSDHQGRYAYNQQPSIGMWNLERFMVCFLNHVSKEKLGELLSEYPRDFEAAYTKLIRKKLGLVIEKKEDYQLFVELLRVMNQPSLDYTFFFRQLAHYQKDNHHSLNAVWEYYGQREELKEWLKKYDQRLGVENSHLEERSLLMLRNNPKFILRNYIAQEVIESVEKGESEKFKTWLKILGSPFDEHPEFEAYSHPTPPNLKDYVVSCSS